MEKEILVDIIILKYNVPKLENECVESVLKYTKCNYHLTIYDNYPKNESLSVVWNRLIKNSNAKYICLLNSDTVVEEGWIEKMIEVFEKEDSVGLVGPTSNKVGGQQGRIKTSEEYQVSELKYVCGFCMVFKKELCNTIGYFDERFDFSSEDNEFSVRSARNGYKNLCRHDVFIFHHFHGSWKERQKRTGQSVRTVDCKKAEGVFKEIVGEKERPDARLSNINKKII